MTPFILRRFRVRYEVRSDGSCVGEGELVVYAAGRRKAIGIACKRVHEEDPRCDVRIDPLVEIRAVTQEEPPEQA